MYLCNGNLKKGSLTCQLTNKNTFTNIGPP